MVERKDILVERDFAGAARRGDGGGSGSFIVIIQPPSTLHVASKLSYILFHPLEINSFTISNYARFS